MIDTADIINKQLSVSVEEERCYKCLKLINVGEEHVTEDVADLGMAYTRHICKECHAGESDNEFLNIVIVVGVSLTAVGLTALTFMG